MNQALLPKINVQNRSLWAS